MSSLIRLLDATTSYPRGHVFFGGQYRVQSKDSAVSTKASRKSICFRQQGRGDGGRHIIIPITVFL